MTRQIEIQRIDGLEQVLHATLLSDPTSRIVLPSEDMLTNVIAVGDEFIRRAAKLPHNEGKVIYTAYQWPENGPATYAVVFAFNTRAPDGDILIQPFTETQEPDEHLLSWEGVEQRLALYSLQTMGRPRLV